MYICMYVNIDWPIFLLINFLYKSDGLEAMCDVNSYRFGF